MTSRGFGGIVLTGGEGRRLGGVDKPSIEIGGRRLIDTALDALADASDVIAVGAPVSTDGPAATTVRWTREEPAGGGPVAAIAAALAHIDVPLVVVLAADLPFVTSAAVGSLVAACQDSVAGVLAVDQDGREQPLLACYRTEALRCALPAVSAGASVRSVMTRLREAGRVELIDLGGSPPVTWDCDTSDDLIRATELA